VPIFQATSDTKRKKNHGILHRVVSNDPACPDKSDLILLRGHMTRFGRWLPRLIVESILIVVSVLAALAVNDWKAGRERSARAEEERAAFAKEIASNRALLTSDTILSHHRRLQAEYSKVTAAGGTDPGTLFETGVHPAALGDAAWRSFSGGSIFADFAADDVLLLSNIYHAQADLERRDEAFLAALLMPRADRDTPEYQRDSARSITLFLNDLVPAEERLLKSYDSALEQLGPKH
jgi:hypothetical protein